MRFRNASRATSLFVAMGRPEASLRWRLQRERRKDKDHGASRIEAAEGNGRTGHARVQAWRASLGNQRPEGQESPASDRHRAQRSRRLEPAKPEGERAE